MAEFASKGVGTGALTTGIIGTSLAGLMALGGNNPLGNLFGNNDKLNALMNENTQLKAEKYTDHEVKAVNAEICGLRQEVTRQGAEIECIKKTEALREELTDSKIARVADAATCGINNLSTSLNCLQNTVNSIVMPFVPAGRVTPLPAPYPYPPMPPYYVPPTTDSSTTETTGN